MTRRRGGNFIFLLKEGQTQCWLWGALPCSGTQGRAVPAAARSRTVTAAPGKNNGQGGTVPAGSGRGQGGAQRTHARPHPPRSPASWGGHTGRAPLGHPRRPETLAKFVPSLTHPPPAQGSSNQSGRRGGGKKKKRIKSTMKRHNKHQLYPKKRSSKFSADERLPRSSAAPPDPHHKLGGGGRGRDFPSVLPFCASPPLRSAPRQEPPRMPAQRAARGCSRGGLRGGGRAAREGWAGPGAASGAAGLLLPIRPGRRRDTARTRTPTLCM